LPTFVARAQESPAFSFVDSDLKFSSPEVRVSIDRARAQALGVSTRDIAQTVQAGMSGQRFGQFVYNGKQYDVIGQLTRAHAFVSEVTLLTDKDQAIPVQVVRNGLRAVAFGGGTSGRLELRYLAANAEILNGDRLVTSGIDGVYPQGLAVATVGRVERDPTNTFARVLCEPAAGIERGRTVLLLAPSSSVAAAQLPDEAGEKPREKSSAKTRRQRAREARGP